MRVVIGNTKDGEIFINSVCMITIDMVKFEANPENLADAAHRAIPGQEAVTLKFCRIAPHRSSLFHS